MDSLLRRSRLLGAAPLGLRGHGNSPPPENPYTGFDDLRGLLDDLRIAKATFVGLSAGSELAINILDVAGVLVTGIARATPVRIPQAGHMVSLDAPELFNQALANFLASP